MQTLNLEKLSLPEGWMWTRLGEVAEIVLGQSPPSSTYNIEGIGLPFYQGKKEFGNLYPTPQKWCTAPKKIAEKGDVLISVRAPVGPTNICPEKSCIGRGLAAIRGLDGIKPRFVLYLMRGCENVIAGKGTGTTFNAIRGKQLREFEIPLPPLPEQYRIVSKIEELFTKLDAGVKSLKNVKTQLQRYRQAILKYAFEGKLTEEWRKTHKDQMELVQKFEERTGEEQKKNEGGKPKESLLTDLSDLHELPTNWMWIRLGDITESMKNGIYKPKRFYRDDGIACLRMYNIENGAIVWKDIKRMILTSEEAQAYELKIGDILVNRVNSRELVGKAAVIPEGLETCVYESKNIRLRLFVNFVDSKYVNFWFQVFRQKYFDRHAQQTVGMASINQEQLSSMPVPLSPLHEQCKIVEEIEHSFSIVNQIEKSVNHSMMQAEKLRHAVLKRAFRGKLVPQDPTDEPAEKLLERINERKKGNTEEKTRKGESDLKQVELMRYAK